MELNEISRLIVDAAVEVHRVLGPGLLESAYVEPLVYELKARGLSVRKEVSVDLNYKKLRVVRAFEIDVLVDQKVIVELKAVERIAPVHKKQTLTYLKLTDRRLGLLLNFGARLMRDGIFRIANDMPESISQVLTRKRDLLFPA